MRDVFLQFAQQTGADVRLLGRDLVGDDTLYTAVVVSLFTDARAKNADELPPELRTQGDSGADLRGFWGDALQPDAQSLGSRLWLLRREKQLPQTLVRAERYASGALQWLIRDGLATAVSVIASNPTVGVLALAVSVTRPDARSQMPVTEQWNFTLPQE